MTQGDDNERPDAPSVSAVIAELFDQHATHCECGCAVVALRNGELLGGTAQSEREPEALHLCAHCWAHEWDERDIEFDHLSESLKVAKEELEYALPYVVNSATYDRESAAKRLFKVLATLKDAETSIPTKCEVCGVATVNAPYCNACFVQAESPTSADEWPCPNDPEEAVKAERARCVRIVNAARAGDIDSDLRSIRSYIEDGDPYPSKPEAV